MTQQIMRTYLDYITKAKWEAEIALFYCQQEKYEEAKKAMSRCQNAAFEAQRRLKPLYVDKEKIDVENST